jgi:flagellar hook-associated protein 2
MPIRITGMNSGLDTESIITALTSTKQTKLDNFKGDQKKLTWKQDKWKELNKKVVSFYNGALSSMRFSTAYTKKTTTASNSSAVSVVTGSNAMDAVQTLSITSLARSSYMSGKEVKAGSEKATLDTEMSSITGFTAGDINFTVGGESKTISVSDSDKVSDVLTKLKEAAGDKVTFNFDESTGRFFAAGKTAGTSGNLSFETSAAASALGLSTATIQNGSKAKIVLNGEEYENDSNTFQINGLTITANELADNITLTTKQDTSGIYDNIKNMLKEYNSLMKEFATLYNSDKATKYKMLTDDQKDAMSDTEVEEWEKKIKDGLLSGDETISTVRNAMKEIMNSSFEVTLKDGSTAKYSLASFGIATGSYFSTEENDRDLLHIDGDEDDTVSSGNADLLKAAISSDPDMIQDFFIKLSQSLYSKMTDLMKGTEYSSSYTIYEDKLMASQYSAYNTKISDAQSALEAAQDKYYKKFATMETALSKINSSSGSLSSFFGTG